MSTAEIKSEIQQVLDSLPEEVLPGVLEYLKRLEKQSTLEKNINKILSEERGLLKRLADS